MPASKVPPLQIIEHVEEANLREVSWNQGFLEEVAGEFKLRHRQAVLFSNKANDRFRLVAMWHGVAVLILPPVNPETQLSLYLVVSRFLKRFSSTGLQDNLDDRIVEARERIKRQAERKAQAKRVLKKGGGG